MQDDGSLELLRSIDRRLALLTGPQERDVRQRLIADILRTQARLRMFDAIDGQRGSPELGRVAQVSERAAQVFVKELLDLGLVRVVGGSTGRGFIVARDDDAIVQWYLRAADAEADRVSMPG